MKIESLRRENFQNTDYFTAQPDGCRQNGLDTETAAVGSVHAGVAFRIVAAQSPAGAHTLSRKPGAGIQPRAERRSIA
jgi:hypothetical protein